MSEKKRCFRNRKIILSEIMEASSYKTIDKRRDNEPNWVWNLLVTESFSYFLYCHLFLMFTQDDHTSETPVTDSPHIIHMMHIHTSHNWSIIVIIFESLNAFQLIKVCTFSVCLSNIKIIFNIFDFRWVATYSTYSE